MENSIFRIKKGGIRPTIIVSNILDWANLVMDEWKMSVNYLRSATQQVDCSNVTLSSSEVV